MDAAPATLEQVERFLAERRKGLDFPEEIENRYEFDTRRRRAAALRAGIPSLALVYNLFLIPDWLLARDVFYLSLFLHLVIVTPWMFVVRGLIRETTPRHWREGLAASVPVLIVLQILVGFHYTNAPDAAHYQYFVLPVILFTNTAQRPPFRMATAVSVIILLCYTAAVLTSGHMTTPVAFVALSIILASAYLTLVSSFYLERDRRRTYLHGLRDRLRHAEAEAASRHDVLTGLANRRYLEERLAAFWQSGDAVSPVAVIMLDIDHFKPFNDHYGHVVGDTCLERIAASIRAELRCTDDLAVRYGGEELLVLLPRTEAADAIRLAERMRRAIEALAIPHRGIASGQVVTASFGVAAASVAAARPQELIEAADAALYAAKRAGRNRVWPPLLRPSEGVASLPVAAKPSA